MPSKKWTIRRFSIFFKILVQIIRHRNPSASSHMEGVWERQIQSALTILLSLLNTHGRSLNDESFRTLLAEAEAVLNSRLLTVDTLGDVQSKQPLCPSNILTMKSKVVLPPPGKIVKADEFSRRRWRCIQHITNSDPSKTEQQMQKFPERWDCAVEDRPIIISGQWQKWLK